MNRKMDKHGELAVRHRNRAEELRAMAEDFSDARREFILILAKDYDRLAATEQKLAEEEKSMR